MPLTADPTLPESKLTQAELTRTMADWIARLRPASTAEALRALRAAFPEIPLAARVMALETMRRTAAGSLR